MMCSRVTSRDQHVMKLEQVPRWIEQERLAPSAGNGDHSSSPDRDFTDPLFLLKERQVDRLPQCLARKQRMCSLYDATSWLQDAKRFENGGTRLSNTSIFGLDEEINSKLYLWRGAPWALEVDAVVNSTNENLDEGHSTPGLHAAAGPELAEECGTLGNCRTGLAKVTNAYDLPARRVIHTVGPKYAFKYHTAAENALSHCYRSCLELLIEQDLQSIAFPCIYTEVKGYPREPAAHVAIRTVRRFLEKHRDKVTALVFCTSSSSDMDIYKRLLPLYFPRDVYEEDIAGTKLPADVGDENGESVISERKIRISALPGTTAIPPLVTPSFSGDVTPTHQSSPNRRLEAIEGLDDPTFMSMTRDPDQRRKEQWEKAAQAQAGWAWSRYIGLGALGGPALTASEEDSLHSRFLARANAVNVTEVAEMKIVYRGGVDVDGRPLMVIVGAHFLLRSLDLERFLLYVIKEFEPLINRPYTIVYLHSAAALQLQPDLGWMKRLQQILGRRHRHNLQGLYVLHPTLGLRAAVMALQVLVDPEVWKKVVYVERLLDLFKVVPREQLTIPDFVFQHDLEVNGENALGSNPRRRAILNRSVLGSYVSQ